MPSASEDLKYPDQQPPNATQELRNSEEDGQYIRQLLKRADAAINQLPNATNRLSKQKIERPVRARDESRPVAETKFSLGGLMESTGETDLVNFAKTLGKSNIAELQALLDDDAFLKQLDGRALYKIVRDSPSLYAKILSEERLYRSLGSLEVFFLARRSLLNCERILNNPHLASQLNGQQLFKLAQEPSLLSAKPLELINKNRNLQDKYQAYLSLHNYPLSNPNDMLPDALKAERQKILACIQTAQIEIDDITQEKFKNSAVKTVLSSDPDWLATLDDSLLNELATTDETFALKNSDFLFKKLSDSSLLRLSKKYVSLCLSILQHSERSQSLDGYDLFHLHQLHSSTPAIHKAITSNPSSKEKYDAYCQLKDYPASEIISSEEEEQTILALFKQAHLNSMLNDQGAVLTSPLVAIVLLKNGLIFFTSLVIDRHPQLASYLIENRHLWKEKFECSTFFRKLANISSPVCLDLFSKPDLADFFTGEVLVDLIKKHDQEVLDKILDTPILLDKYHAYHRLQQPNAYQIAVRPEQTQKDSQTLVANKNYERGLFALEQNQLERAFYYFNEAVTENYAPAIFIIENITSRFKAINSTEDAKKYLASAQAFADPRKLFYNQTMASLLYKYVSDYCHAMSLAEQKESTQLSSAQATLNPLTKIQYEADYHLARRLALGLGIKADKEQADRLLAELMGGATQNQKLKRQELINLVRIEAQNRQKIKAELAEEKQRTETELKHKEAYLASVQMDDARQEPAVLFLHAQIDTCSSHQEKASRHVQLFILFLKLGYKKEAQISLEKAKSLHADILSPQGYGLLADLQQSAVQTRASSLEEQKPPFSLAKWNEPLSNHLKAVEKAPENSELRSNSIAQALSLITFICCNDDEVALAPENIALNHENAKTILSLSSLCAELKPEVLYAICLKSDPPILPALPSVVASPPKANNSPEPDSLEAEPVSDYIENLLRWANTEEKSIDILFVLAEAFLNGDLCHYHNYQRYFDKAFDALFEKLKSPHADFKQHERYVQRLCTLGLRLANNNLEQLLQLSASGLPQKTLEGLPSLIINLWQHGLNSFTENALRYIFNSSTLCANLPPAFLYAVCLRLQQAPPLSDNIKILKEETSVTSAALISLDAQESKQTKPLPEDYLKQFIDWVKTNKNSNKKLEILLKLFSKNPTYNAYVTMCLAEITQQQPATTFLATPALEEQKAYAPLSWSEPFLQAIHHGSIQTITVLYSRVEQNYQTLEAKYALIESVLGGNAFQNIATFEPTQSQEGKSMLSFLSKRRRVEQAEWQRRQAIVQFFFNQWQAALFPAWPSELAAEKASQWMDLIFNARQIFGIMVELTQEQRQALGLLFSQYCFHHTRPQSPSTLSAKLLHKLLAKQIANELQERVIPQIVFLLQQGADPNACDIAGNTPLMQAIRYRHHRHANRWYSITLINLLLQQPGIKIEHANQQQKTALSLAWKSRQFRVVWLLLSHSKTYQHQLGSTAAYVFSGLGLFSAWLGALTLWTTAPTWAWWLIGTGFALVGMGIMLGMLSFYCKKTASHAAVLVLEHADHSPSPAHHFQPLALQVSRCQQPIIEVGNSIPSKGVR